MKLTRHNGRSGKHGTYNPKHNDRTFDVSNSEHIDEERAKHNVYWDCFNGYRTFAEKQVQSELADTFEEVEELFYSAKYGAYVEAQNARNDKNRHSERNRTTTDLLKDKRTCPEETIYQIGKMGDHVSPDVLLKVVTDFFVEMERRFGSHVHILDWALHLDEATPHIQERHVFDCENRYGEICPQQEKALEAFEEIKSFLSRQKETYKVPYETHPADRKRQCVFGGSSNTLDFLPLDRTGNRRFVPVMVYPERAEVHILDNEEESRAYIHQMWAEAMAIYRSRDFKLRFSPTMNEYVKAHQREFMPEDTKAGQILDYLDSYTGNAVCSKQLYREALGHEYDEPKQWELREINDIMNNVVKGWKSFSNPRHFPKPYLRQKGWERELPDNGEADNGDGRFIPLSDAELEQMELPEGWR